MVHPTKVKSSVGAEQAPSSGSKPRRQRPQRRSLSSSSGSESGSDDEDTDRAAMLAALQAHGRAMFDLVDQSEEGSEPINGESSAQGAKRLRSVSAALESGESGEGDSGHESFDSDEEMINDGTDDDEDDDEDESTPAQSAVPEVVFASAPRRTEMISKAERRAFLQGSSSKLMGIKSEDPYSHLTNKRRKKEAAADEEDDQSNRKLDKTLHDMLMSNLLSTSSAPNCRSRPIDKQKAVSGRLLELAQYELPGQGSSSLGKSSLSSQPAKIRTGIVHAKAKREAKAAQEAEAASWVRGIGTVRGGAAGGGGGGGVGTKKSGRERRAGLGVEVGKKKGMDGRRGKEGRDRGLAMGVGKFKGGMLSLSQREMARATERERPSHKGKKRSRR